MKRWISLVLALICAFTFTSCDGGEEDFYTTIKQMISLKDFSFYNETSIQMDGNFADNIEDSILFGWNSEDKLVMDGTVSQSQNQISWNMGFLTPNNITRYVIKIRLLGKELYISKGATEQLCEQYPGLNQLFMVQTIEGEDFCRFSLSAFLSTLSAASQQADASKQSVNISGSLQDPAMQTMTEYSVLDESSSYESTSDTSFSTNSADPTDEETSVDASLETDSSLSEQLDAEFSSKAGENTNASIDTENEYYQQGYRTGYAAGYQDGASNQWLAHYEDASYYEGDFKRLFETGYRHGYEDGFAQGGQDTSSDNSDEAPTSSTSPEEPQSPVAPSAIPECDANDIINSLYTIFTQFGDASSLEKTVERWDSSYSVQVGKDELFSLLQTFFQYLYNHDIAGPLFDILLPQTMVTQKVEEFQNIAQRYLFSSDLSFEKTGLREYVLQNDVVLNLPQNASETSGSWSFQNRLTVFDPDSNGAIGMSLLDKTDSSAVLHISVEDAFTTGCYIKLSTNKRFTNPTRYDATLLEDSIFEVKLAGLDSNTKYYVMVGITDAAKNIIEDETVYDFTTDRSSANSKDSAKKTTSSRSQTSSARSKANPSNGV